jgi:hypothetical protein
LTHDSPAFTLGSSMSRTPNASEKSIAFAFVARIPLR